MNKWRFKIIKDLKDFGYADFYNLFKRSSSRLYRDNFIKTDFIYGFEFEEHIYNHSINLSLIVYAIDKKEYLSGETDPFKIDISGFNIFNSIKIPDRIYSYTEDKRNISLNILYYKLKNKMIKEFMTELKKFKTINQLEDHLFKLGEFLKPEVYAYKKSMYNMLKDDLPDDLKEENFINMRI